MNVQSVLWCLEELDLAYSRIDAGFTYGLVTTPAFLEMNPNGKVPVLIDGDGPAIFEAGAILRFLATQYAVGPFWPGPPRHARLINGQWAKNFASHFTADVFCPQKRTAVTTIMQHYSALASIERASILKGFNLYLAGDDFSLADIQMGHCLYRYYDIDVVRADLPHLQAYYSRLQTRPGFSHHVMASYDELRVTKG